MYWNVCNKYRKFRKIKISHIFYEYGKIFKEEESIEILKVLGLINDIEEYQRIYNHAWRKHISRI